ncbi:phasin-related domain-containing protein [Paenibacillus sp. D51F]
MNKAFSLGLGLAASTREQAEKLAQELSAKGDMSKADSQQFVSSMIQRGQEAKGSLETFVRERVKAVTDELNLVHREELQRLEKRIADLESRLGIPSEHAAATAPGSTQLEQGAYEGTGKAGPGVPPVVDPGPGVPPVVDPGPGHPDAPGHSSVSAVTDEAAEESARLREERDSLQDGKGE